jgi:uncharacterized membrane protein
MSNLASLNLAGVTLIIIGIAIVFLSIIITTVKTKHKAKIAGIMLIGLFPITVGTDRESVRILLILIIVVIMHMTIFLLKFLHHIRG